MGGEELGVITHHAVLEADPSVGAPYSVRPMHCRSLSKAENVELPMRKIRSACFVLNLCAPATFLYLAKMTLGLLRELVMQKCALQGRRAVGKVEDGKVTEIKNEEEEAVVYGDFRPVKQSRRE